MHFSALVCLYLVCATAAVKTGIFTKRPGYQITVKKVAWLQEKIEECEVSGAGSSWLQLNY